MKKILTSLVMVILLASCSRTDKPGTVTPESVDTVVNINVNLIISPDLSNRITDKYSKPLDDVEIISKVMDLYYPFIYTSEGRAIGQKDKISIQITNPQLLLTYNIDNEPLEIDFSNLSNEERIRYLTDSLMKNNFKDDKKRLINEIAKTYEKARQNTVGADIYNLFQSRLNDDLVLADMNPFKSLGKLVVNKNRNILVLLTDGYIEAGLYGSPAEGNLYYHLDNDVIRIFREEFLNSGEKDLKKFFEQQGYGLVPVNNNALKNLEVFAIEFYDRSLSRVSGNNTVIPDDYDIIKLFWEDWLTKSGVKRFKIYERFATITEFERAFKNFISEN